MWQAIETTHESRNVFFETKTTPDIGHIKIDIDVFLWDSETHSRFSLFLTAAYAGEIHTQRKSSHQYLEMMWQSYS